MVFVFLTFVTLFHLFSIASTGILQGVYFVSITRPKRDFHGVSVLSLNSASTTTVVLEMAWGERRKAEGSLLGVVLLLLCHLYGSRAF